MGSPKLPEGNWPSKPIPTDDMLRRYTQRYVYDRVGNFLRMEHRAGAGSWTRYYDTAADSNRLLRTWEGDASWDSGNAIEKTDYGHDPHGSMLNLLRSPESFNLRWDHRDMIRHIDLGGGGKAWYQYDSGKQRTRKHMTRQPQPGGTDRTVKEERIYLGGYELYRRYINDPDDPIEELESHHLFEGEQRVLLVDDVLKAKASSQPGPNGSRLSEQTVFRYQYGNHLGSVGVELDETARVISYEEFHPYGTSAYRVMNSAIEVQVKRNRYTGMERDEESGLSYHSARYLSTSIGRWVSSDPRGLVDSICIYQYARGNPISGIDLNGTETFLRPEEHANLILSGLEASPSGVNDDHDISGIPEPIAKMESKALQADAYSGFSGGEVDEYEYVPPPSIPGFWSRGGSTLVFGLAALIGGVFLLASGPVGWGALLVGALAVSGGGAAVAWGGTHLSLSYSGMLNEKSEAAMNMGGEVLLHLSSPGGIVGMTVGASFADEGNIDPVLTGGSVGGFAEGAWSLAKGLGRMAAKEIQYGLPDGRYGFEIKNWDDRRPYLQEVFGFSDPASRARPNSLFQGGVETIELSHWWSQKSTKGASSFFDRPWNLRAVWGTEHGLMDPSRYKTMLRSWKAVNKPLGKFTSAAKLMPEWALESLYGMGLMTKSDLLMD
jgi:RHS repeat-associated protein